MKEIDFSCKHNIMIRDRNGEMQPMDEPYFRSVKIADGTWQVLSDGDYTYVVEGEKETLVIDSGYGCGNIREYCQSLTSSPIYHIANTHDHFDHTANNCYFDCAYMSEKTKPLATIPFPSFEGIDFPRDYRVCVIDEGYIFDLGNRTLEVLSVPCHAVGSLAFLDRSRRILFCGDEISNEMMMETKSLQKFYSVLLKMEKYRSEFDTLCCGGSGVLDAAIIESYIANVEHIMAGFEGDEVQPGARPVQEYDEQGRMIYDRRMPRLSDMPQGGGKPETQYRRVMRYAGCEVLYDMRNIYE